MPKEERQWAPDLDLKREGSVGRDDGSQAGLTRMIECLIATACKDRSQVLDVCIRASADKNNAKEAVRTLRRHFKYGESPAQLSAARLWILMLRNSSDIFIVHSTSRKFLGTLEDLLSSSRTSPVVRERILEVVAAAAYASGSKKDSRHDREGFKGLWKRVKPFDESDEGIPFDTDDAMFGPPISPIEIKPGAPIPNAPEKKGSSSRRNRIAALEEDTYSPFQEWEIGRGNAALLSQALALTKPEDLGTKSHIQELYMKCLLSQELVFAQLQGMPSPEPLPQELQKNTINASARAQNAHLDSRQICVEGEETTQDPLITALLATNQELQEVMSQYENLSRLASRPQKNDHEAGVEDGRDDRPEQADGRDYEQRDARDDAQPVVGRGKAQQINKSKSAPTTWSPFALVGRTL